MAVRPNTQPQPRKCGVVLTCFDNGRKRFRVVPIEGNDLVDQIEIEQAAQMAAAQANAPIRTQRPSF
ncbi:MAG: hypothetical protein KF841_13430 [Phycisphaerae bacterium]|nr:hypothetical protein [Phycisphaerae bacterium]